ncbi:hypothetical protein [Nocardioides salsibiostraticola]
MGRAPHGSKPRDVAVFAQHLSGGSEITIFNNLNNAGSVVRLRQRDVFSARHLMAGFALVEPRLPLEGEALACAERLRKVADSGDLHIEDPDATLLAVAVNALDVILVLTDCQETLDNAVLDSILGDWVVTKSRTSA